MPAKAPYAGVWRDTLPRLCELVETVEKPRARKAYFRDFDDSLADNPIKLKHFIHIEADLRALDIRAWAHIKAMVAGKFAKEDPRRGWQQAFDILNEAKAYRYLVGLGCSEVEFLPTSEKKTPDLQARWGTEQILCEVKTINAARNTQHRLPDVFFKKLASRLAEAEQQMASFCEDAAVRRVVYVILNFDDLLHEHVAAYLEQVRAFAVAMPPSPTDIVFDVKPAFYAATISSPPAQIFICTRDRSWQELEHSR